MPRIPDLHLQSVVYVFPSEESAQSGERAGGSGFVASYPSERGNWRFQYVVTNQHVVDQGGHWIRLNQAEGTHVVHIPPDDWVSASDGDDLAVALLDVPEHVKPYWLALDEGALTAEEVRELGVGPGDECYMVGRLVTHGGRLTNNPVARFGNIALMPTKAEPIRDGRGRDVIAYLIEMRSHSGFSGSPVFLLIPANTFRGRFGGVKNDNTTRFRLLGIDTGHLHHHEWIEEQQEDNTWSKRPDLRVAYNTDIAIVAPISQLVRLLEREDLVAERQRHDDEAEPGHESAK